MKKLLTVFSVIILAISLAFTLVACGKGDGGDSGLKEPLTEGAWKGSFDFSNVTAVVEVSVPSLEGKEIISLKFYGGKCYSSTDGEHYEDCGDATANAETFNFSNHFAKFEFKNGKYSLKDGERIVITEGAMYYTDVVVGFSGDGRITSIDYVSVRTNGTESMELEYSFSFFNYGKTTAESSNGLDSDEGGGSETGGDDEEQGGGSSDGEVTVGVEVSESEWSAAFAPSNVTIAAKNLTPGVSNPDATFVICGGTFYISSDGRNFSEQSSVNQAYDYFNFASQYSKFEFKDGEYTVKSGETALLATGGGVEIQCDATIKFNSNGQLVSVAYTGTVDGNRTMSFSFEFYDYGKTSAPSTGVGGSDDSGVSGGESVNPGKPDSSDVDFNKELTPPDGVGGDQVTEQQWISAFKPQNVTCVAITATIDGQRYPGLMKICDGDVYTSEDGISFDKYGSYEEAWTQFLFGDSYSSFEFSDGLYQNKNGEPIVIDMYGDELVYNHIYVKFNSDGELVSVYAEQYYEVSEGHPIVAATTVFDFYDYGVTTSPIGEESGDLDGVSPKPGSGSSVSEIEWSTAFKPENVSIIMLGYASGVDLTADAGVIRFVNGKCYCSYDECVTFEDFGDADENYDAFDLSGYYDKFEFVDGSYSLKSGESVLIYEDDMPQDCYEATVRFNEDGELIYIFLRLAIRYGNDAFKLVCEYEFFDYGVTEVPDTIVESDMGGGNSSSSSSSSSSGSLPESPTPKSN